MSRLPAVDTADLSMNYHLNTDSSLPRHALKNLQGQENGRLDIGQDQILSLISVQSVEKTLYEFDRPQGVEASFLLPWQYYRCPGNGR
jgi:hypothetical protein